MAIFHSYVKLPEGIEDLPTPPFLELQIPLRLAGVFRYAQTQPLIVFMSGGWIDAVVHSTLVVHGRQLANSGLFEDYFINRFILTLKLNDLMW